MIVSRGVLESGGIDTPAGGTLRNGNELAAVPGGRFNVGGGSTLSLPYSNRTQLTNSSSRSMAAAGYDARGVGATGGPIESNGEENHYETLPNADGDEVHQPPTNRVSTLAASQSLSRPPAQLQRLREEEEVGGGGSGVDDSVISAHHSGIYHHPSTSVLSSSTGMLSRAGKGLFKDKILLSTELGDETRL